MTNKISNDPFAPWDQDAHSRDLEKTDQFNRMVDEVAQHPLGLRRQLEALANSDNSEVIAALAEHGITSPRVPQRFRLSNGQEATVWADDSGWHSAAIFNGEQINFSAANATRDEVLMLPEKYLQQNSGPRELTEAELTRLARMVQRGETVAACELAVALRLNGKDRRSEREILEDPRYRKLLDESAVTIWRFSRREYVFDQEFEDLLARAAKTKPLSVNTVDCLFDLFQEQKAAAARSTRPAAPVAGPESEQPSQEEIQVGLENLTDKQLADLKTKTLRERGRRVMALDREMFGRE